MTRITDEAVEAALDVLFDHGHNGIKCYDPQSGLDATVHAALEAALPHLEGATPTCSGCSVDPSPEQGIPDRFIADGDCPVHGEGATPAIDREALALAHHRFYCHAKDPECSEVDEADCDFADFTLALTSDRNVQKERKPREYHGMTNTAEYHAWEAIEQRCYNPNDKRYADYGGRGITRDPAWDVFGQFYADMGPRPDGTSLDRIDNDGPYSAENCRWATVAQQLANQRPRKLKDFCGRGHKFTAENTAYRKGGARFCRTCARASERARYWRKKAAS